MQPLQRSWLGRGMLAWSLRPLAALYGLAWRIRRALYRQGWRHAERLPVPVIVVGNLIVGGAGKTPTVRAVVATLAAHGWHPGIVSRGYGRQANGVSLVTTESAAEAVGDEPLLLRRATGAPVAVGRDRPAAARALLGHAPLVDGIVADAGLQHLALARDVEVLVFDERGAGNGWLLPAGPLREPLPRALAPRQLVLYNAAAPSTPLPGWLARRRLAGATPLEAWWRGAAPDAHALDALRGRTVWAAAGMAQPGRYFDMLRAAELDVTPLALPDHHDYRALPWPDGVDVLVTEKDAVKLAPERCVGARVWVVALDFEPDAGFTARLLALLPPRPTADDGHSPD